MKLLQVAAFAATAFITASGLGLAGTAAAQPAPAAASAALTVDAKMKDLIANPGAKAVLDKHIPQVMSDSRLPQAMDMSLREVAPYASLSDDTLKAIDADLAKLGHAGH